MTDKVKEFYDSLQERLKSPFILSFLIVWSIKHWRLLLIVLNFKDDEPTFSKEFIIDNYIKEQSLWYIWGKEWHVYHWVGMVIPALLWTIFSIAAYYALTILSETIGVWYKRLKSWVMVRLNENRAIVTIEEHQAEIRKNSKIQERLDSINRRYGDFLESYEKEKSDYEKNAEILRADLTSSKRRVEKLQLEHNSATLELTNKNAEIERLKQKITLSTSQIELAGEVGRKMGDQITEKDKEITELRKMNDNLKKSDGLKIFIDGEGTRILRDLFGADEWEFTAIYPNHTIKERFKLSGNFFKLTSESNQRIFISNTSLKGTRLLFSKSNTNIDNPYFLLDTILDISNINLLTGTEGKGRGNVTYKRV